MPKGMRPTNAFPKADTPEGRDYQDKLVDAQMRQTVLRNWLRDEVNQWSADQIQAYIDDETKPFIRRNFLKTVVQSKKESTQIKLMEQLDGKATQYIEASVNTPEPISLEVFGEKPQKIETEVSDLAPDESKS